MEDGRDVFVVGMGKMVMKGMTMLRGDQGIHKRVW